MKKSERRSDLKQFHHLLNTAEGAFMMEELRRSWLDGNPLDSCPQTMGFNIGLAEAYKQLAAWQTGEGLEDE